MQVFFFIFFLGAGNDQNARAGSGERSGEVWRVDMKKGGGEGETGRGTMGKGRLGEGNGEREEGNGEGGNREGEMGMGGNWVGEMGREGKDGGKHIECLGGMRLQFFLTLLTRATPGTSASLY